MNPHMMSIFQSKIKGFGLRRSKSFMKREGQCKIQIFQVFITKINQKVQNHIAKITKKMIF